MTESKKLDFKFSEDFSTKIILLQFMFKIEFSFDVT